MTDPNDKFARWDERAMQDRKLAHDGITELLKRLPRDFTYADEPMLVFRADDEG
jgi:hypothetical protein